MGYKRGYYKKDGTYVQAHYANNKSRSFSNRNNKGCLLILLVSVILGSMFACSDSSRSDTKTSSSNCPTKTCGDFSSQTQAQSTYNSDKKCYKNLDADGDGIACENLSK